MVGTKARWFRRPGSKPVYEPQRAPDRTRYPRATPEQVPRYPNLPPYKSPPAPPGRVPHGDPRFPGYVPEPERTPRPITRPAGRRPFGRKVPKLRLPGINPLFETAAEVAETVFRNPDQNVVPVLPWNYRWCNGPVPWPPALQYHPPYFFGNSGSCAIGLPITGQTSQASTQDGIGAGVPRSYFRRGYRVAGGSTLRDAIAGTVEKIAESNPQPSAHPPILHARWGNPNVDRWTPSVPDPWAPTSKPDLQVGVGVPLPGPTPITNTDSPYEPDYQWSFQVGTGPAFGVPGRNDTPVVMLPPPPPVGREPPAKGEKQGKLLSKTAKVGIALFKALDVASEAAEVVDAVYEALPSDVRKRWEKAMFPDARWIKDKQTGKWIKVGMDRPGDNFGQYGLDGADWKLRALYHNWHRLDKVEAVKNIIKNELQDQVIGAMQKRLPKNTGQAHSQGEREVAKLLDQWFEEELGL